MWSGAALGNFAQSTVAANAYVKKVFLFFTESSELITVPIVT